MLDILILTHIAVILKAFFTIFTSQHSKLHQKINTDMISLRILVNFCHVFFESLWAFEIHFDLNKEMNRVGLDRWSGIWHFQNLDVKYYIFALQTCNEMSSCLLMTIIFQVVHVVD